MKTIFMFSGQGGQYYHMGQPLYASNEAFHEHLENIENELRDRHGLSVLNSLYTPGRSKVEPFADPVLSSLAIFMIESALTETLAGYHLTPDVILSVSMGGYAGICAGGATDRSAMLDLLLEQSKILERTCVEGTMLAVLAPVELYEQSLSLTSACELAGVSSANHFVVSLPRSHLAGVEEFLTSKKVTFQRLPVALAYHSRWLDAAKHEFVEAARKVAYTETPIPIHLSLGPGPEPLTTDSLWKAARQPICFREAVFEFEKQGPHRYIDVGTSGTLATVLKYALSSKSESSIHPILTPMGQEERNLKNLLEAVVPHFKAR